MRFGRPAPAWLFFTCAFLFLSSLVGVQGQTTPGRSPTQSAESAPLPAVPRPSHPVVRPVSSASRSPDAATVATQKALVDQYCVTCHNARLKTANLSLEGADFNAIGDHAEMW